MFGLGILKGTIIGLGIGVIASFVKKLAKIQIKIKLINLQI
jgi:hypothetical protein